MDIYFILMGRSNNKLNKTMKWILPMGKTWRLHGVIKSDGYI